MRLDKQLLIQLVVSETRNVFLGDQEGLPLTANKHRQKKIAEYKAEFKKCKRTTTKPFSPKHVGVG